MAFRLLLLSPESDEFERLLEIEDTATLFDLHLLILQSVDYPKDLFTSFLLCDEDYNVLKEITNDEDADNKADTMKGTNLASIINNEEVQLVYVFDSLTERCFFVNFVGDCAQTENSKRIVRSKGKAPNPMLSEEEMNALIFAETSDLALEEEGALDFSLDEDELSYSDEFGSEDLYSDNSIY